MLAPLSLSYDISTLFVLPTASLEPPWTVGDLATGELP